MMLAGWLVAGVAMAACLYDPAFATLYRVSGASYRRAVTALTLFGGFASTVFWPLSQYLLESHGWRAAFAVHAALNACVGMPLHLVFVPSPSHRSAMHAAVQPARRRARAALDVRPGSPPRSRSPRFLRPRCPRISSCLLTAGGLAARDAVLVGALIGPMQVAGRVMEFAFSSRWSPLTVGTLAFTLLASALIMLCFVRGVWILALAFALLYGWSNGVMTIVRGTVPGVLFGSRDYGALLGRLAQPQFILKSFAPVAVTLLFALGDARRVALYTLAGAGIAALLAYRAAIRGPAPAESSGALIAADRWNGSPTSSVTRGRYQEVPCNYSEAT